MGYTFLLFSNIASAIKMIVLKKCGSIATGIRNSIIINIIRSFGCFAVSLAVCLAFGFGKMDQIGFVISVFSGISNGLLLCTWIIAASSLPLITVESFSMFGGIVLPLLVSPLIFASEVVSVIQWSGVFFLFAAMLCLTKNTTKTKFTVKGIAPLLVCVVANFGCVITKKLFTSFSAGTIRCYQMQTFLFCLLTLCVLFCFIPKIKEHGTARFNNKAVIYITIAVVMQYLYEYLATTSTLYLPSSVFYPLSYVISMPLIFLADVLIYKERITKNSVIGIILVIISGILINL